MIAGAMPVWFLQKIDIMARKSKAKSNQAVEKIAAIGSLLILITAWWLGGLQISERQLHQLDSLITDSQQLTKVKEGLYRIMASDTQSGWLSTGSGVGYGGEMNVAVKIDQQGNIEQTAILSIKDTSSYVTKVIDNGLINQILGASARTGLSVDAISGATLSSNGIAQAANSAIDPVREQLYGYRLEQQSSPLDNLGLVDLLAVLFFALAVMISRSSSKHKTKMQWTLMVGSLLLFGFYSAALISSSTMGILISGSWSAGLGNYTAIILLVLCVAYILLFNKNIYCQMLCPMGVTQQCLSRLTRAKAIPLKHKVFQWIPRAILLATLAAGLCFRNPAAFSYEPFGIMFGMVGSMYLFILTFLILITSLLVHRPWCKTLCPITAMTDYLLFFKQWYKQASKAKKRANKARSKGKSDKPRKKNVNPCPADEQPIAVKIEEG
jgi:polyferredoxin/uncharacterized protein with FMN-binding domain